MITNAEGGHEEMRNPALSDALLEEIVEEKQHVLVKILVSVKVLYNTLRIDHLEK